MSSGHRPKTGVARTGNATYPARRARLAAPGKADLIRDPVAEWQELSTLYEQGEGLDVAARQAWLHSLPTASPQMRSRLERMLLARDRVADEGFLESSPGLPPAEAGSGDWAEGARVGPYRLVRPLGEGGMAEVWLAARVDGAFERNVAIKLPFDHPTRAERESFSERFRRERDILASLDHPHIAALHDAGVAAGGQPWLALEYVEGAPITAWCDRRRASIEARVDIFRQVLVAVEHAHANLVIHRDLKPANILVTEAGEVKLLDFGIAKLLRPSEGESADSELTRQGGRPMTLKYASPEQFTGKPLTTASDQYSLGVVLYELLCGESPYEGRLDSSAQVEEAVIEREPRVPSRRTLGETVVAARQQSRRGLAQLLAADLEAVPLKALRKDAHERYGSVEAMRLDLERWQQRKPLQVKVPTAAYRLKKFVRRNPLGVVSGSLATLALVGVTVGAVAMEMRARREADRAIAASNFVSQVFRMADPGAGTGNQVTAKALLEGGRRMAAVDLKDEPDLQASVLASIGQMQNYLGLYPPAVSTYQQAADIYAARGANREWAMMMSRVASNLRQQGEAEKARETIDKAAIVAAGHPGDLELAAVVRQVQGEVAAGLGDYASAEIHLQAALVKARIAFGNDDPRTIEPLRALSDALENLGKEDAALQTLDLAATLAARHSGHAREGVIIENERAGLEYAYGHYSKAARTTEVGLPRCDQLLTPLHDDCVYTALVRAATLLRLGDAKGASELMPRLLEAAANEMSPRRQLGSLTAALRIAAETDAEAGVKADLERRLSTQAMGGGGESRDRAFAAIALAESRLAASDLEGALRWSREARRVIESARFQNRSLIGRARLLEGLAYQQGGRQSEAMAAFAAGQSDLMAGMRKGHPLLAYWALNQVPSMVALNDLTGARSRIFAARKALAGEVDTGAPLWKKIDELSSSIDNPNAAPRKTRESNSFL